MSPFSSGSNWSGRKANSVYTIMLKHKTEPTNRHEMHLFSHCGNSEERLSIQIHIYDNRDEFSVNDQSLSTAYCVLGEARLLFTAGIFRKRLSRSFLNAVGHL